MLENANTIPICIGVDAEITRRQHERSRFEGDAILGVQLDIAIAANFTGNHNRLGGVGNVLGGCNLCCRILRKFSCRGQGDALSPHITSDLDFFGSNFQLPNQGNVFYDLQIRRWSGDAQTLDALIVLHHARPGGHFLL